MDAETRKEFQKIHEQFSKMDARFDSLETKMGEGFEEVKDMMEHGFSQLLPKDQWPPSGHDLQQAEIRRKL